MSRLSLQGAALFAFIPLVLYLYLELPLGAGGSLIVGLLLMFGHRFLAAPWMARHATERCLWCGRSGDLTERFVVQAAGRPLTLAACGPEHRGWSARFLNFAARFRAWIGAGIFLPLIVLLGGTAALALGHPLIPLEGNRLQFKLVVAATVVATSMFYRLGSPSAGSLVSPFPLHNLFLLGVRSTLWVFRLVGIYWLVTGLVSLAGRR
ncbi:MAG TPA: hypothetical protein VGB99_16680 [Acidobacteriota bacterium]